MRILVIGGMHGNEPLGIDVVKSLRNNPVANIDTIIANPAATWQNRRFMNRDLNRSFGVNDDSYESKRAQFLLSKCQNYDIVFDFHNTHCPDNDCAFIGKDANAKLLDIASILGLSRVIVADYDCINKFAPNCISVEISMTSPRNSALIWCEIIKMLACMKNFDTIGKPNLFKFAYRMTLDDAERLALSSSNVKAFSQLDPKIAAQLGVKSPAFPIFIADKFTPYNFGGIVTPISNLP